MIVIAMLLVGLLVLGLVAMLALRRWTLDEARTEKRLSLPATHKVVYDVPAGQDAAVLAAALAHAGFTARASMEQGIEKLVVECEPSDRAAVRDVIEHVDRAGFDGPKMHVAHVAFEDEG